MELHICEKEGGELLYGVLRLLSWASWDVKEVRDIAVGLPAVTNALKTRQ